MVREALRSYVGVLVSGGYKAYDNHAKSIESVVHAQCWSHARKCLIEFDHGPAGV